MAMGEDAPRIRMSGPERRRAILAAAREAFARNGYHGAGTAMIAAAAGCSEAVLYRHFASKRELLAAVLEDEVADRTRTGRAMAPPAGVEASSALPRTLAARLRDEEMATTVRLILMTIGNADELGIGPDVRAVFERVREPLRAAIASGQASGWVRDDVDPELATWLWHGLFLVAAVRNTIAADGVAMEAVDAAELLSRLLAPPG
jgi:AcrR family transcriptional regulator